jgi:hypothetical protein
MAIITWFTQPKNSLASCYAYDNTTKKFVRIRLELGRTGDHNETKIMVKENRYIGFSDQLFDTKTITKWSVVSNKIQFGAIKLDNTPLEGMYVYDFSLPAGNQNPTFIHWGNVVTKTPKLPPGIDEDTMIRLATYYLSQPTGDTIMTGSTATPDELSQALNKLIREIPMEL